MTDISTHARVPQPINEPVKTHAPGTPERAALKSALTKIANERLDIPIIHKEKEIRHENRSQAVMPHNHAHVLADWRRAGPEDVAAAIVRAKQASHDWSRTPFESRAAIFLKAADLLAGPWRATLNAATMLGQSKSVFQAEIDSAAELIDFWRFNAHFAQEIHHEQPISDRGMWNRLDYRPLEGFVYAVSPFNFTSIAGNLPTAPAMMGNTVVWKPSEHSMLSAYYLMKLLEAAGLPPGVINMAPGDPKSITDVVLADQDFAGLHFTGSSAVFSHLWKSIGQNIDHYRCFPRVVGETGGKNFVVAHPSADVAALAVALTRGGFEYQGQKCSAVGRAYIPRSLWSAVQDQAIAIMHQITLGDVSDFQTFMGAVIHKPAFDRITGMIDLARSTSGSTSIIEGGQADDSVGYFIRPTLIQTTDPTHPLMTAEVFGPVVTVYVYDDAAPYAWNLLLQLIDDTSSYALTGAIFAADREAIVQASSALRHAAGNFYINDKPTGAVVGQQPFGGARHSGTNDKAGSKLNLLRWVSPRTIKENFVPPTDFRYPHMNEP